MAERPCGNCLIWCVKIWKWNVHKTYLLTFWRILMCFNHDLPDLKRKFPQALQVEKLSVIRLTVRQVFRCYFSGRPQNMAFPSIFVLWFWGGENLYVIKETDFRTTAFFVANMGRYPADRLTVVERKSIDFCLAIRRLSLRTGLRSLLWHSIPRQCYTTSLGLLIGGH